MQRTFNRSFSKAWRQQLRREMTPQERTLWVHLRNRKIAGFKFRTQVGIGRYIGDFFSFDCMLAIELDGHQHETPSGRAKDKVRDDYARSLGITVLRFPNARIDHDLDNVLREIRTVAVGLRSPTGTQG